MSWVKKAKWNGRIIFEESKTKVGGRMFERRMLCGVEDMRVRKTRRRPGVPPTFKVHTAWRKSPLFLFRRHRTVAQSDVILCMPFASSLLLRFALVYDISPDPSLLSLSLSLSLSLHLQELNSRDGRTRSYGRIFRWSFFFSSFRLWGFSREFRSASLDRPRGHTPGSRETRRWGTRGRLWGRENEKRQKKMKWCWRNTRDDRDAGNTNKTLVDLKQFGNYVIKIWRVQWKKSKT